jgi:hypothetical protein
LRDHQVVDAPVHAARGFDANLANDDRVADILDTPHKPGVDVKDVLIDDQIGPEFFDLGQQDLLGLCIKLGAKADLAGQRPEHRL